VFPCFAPIRLEVGVPIRDRRLDDYLRRTRNEAAVRRNQWDIVRDAAGLHRYVDTPRHGEQVGSRDGRRRHAERDRERSVIVQQRRQCGRRAHAELIVADDGAVDRCPV